MAQRQRTVYKCGQCNIFFATMELFVRHACALPSSNGMETQSSTLSTPDSESEPEPDITEEDQGDIGDRQEDDSSMETHTRQLNLWNRASTLLLINEYAKLKKKQESGLMRKNQMWDKISEQMRKYGYNFSSEQVSGRWKTIIRAYKNVKDHNNKSGNDLKTYEFQDELDEVLGADPAVTPEAIRSSTKRGTESCSDSNTGSEKGEESVGSVAKKPRRSGSSEVVEMFRAYLTEQKEKEPEDQARRLRMHEEKMSLLNNLVKALSGPRTGRGDQN